MLSRAGMLSRAASKGSLGVQVGEAAQDPDGKDIPVARVADGTGLVEDPRDVLLEGKRTGHQALTALSWTAALAAMDWCGQLSKQGQEKQTGNSTVQPQPSWELPPGSEPSPGLQPSWSRQLLQDSCRRGARGQVEMAPALPESEGPCAAPTQWGSQG